MNRDDVVFLTGYPSLMARAVCGEVLASDPKAKVVALVRAKSVAEARAARDEMLSERRKRLRFLEGDAASIDLGLSGTEWKTLAREVTRIHHCAQVTYLGVDRKSAEHLNVEGALEILELARACEKLEALVHHSTAQVSGSRRGTVLEDELEAGQSFRTVVEETKARAEKLLRAAMDTLPIVVGRPSSIALGREPSARGRTFHLVDPAPLSTRRVFELVARAGGRRGPRGSIPTHLAKALLRAPGLDRISKSPRAFLETLTTPVTYDARKTTELLPRLGVSSCPPFESYVDQLVEFVKERVRQRRAGRAVEVEAPDPLG